MIHKKGQKNMKEVRIDGKRYNINTAEFIASWDNDLPYMDFGYLKETLYRKRTGELFPVR